MTIPRGSAARRARGSPDPASLSAAWSPGIIRLQSLRMTINRDFMLSQSALELCSSPRSSITHVSQIINHCVMQDIIRSAHRTREPSLVTANHLQARAYYCRHLLIIAGPRILLLVPLSMPVYHIGLVTVRCTVQLYQS